MAKAQVSAAGDVAELVIAAPPLNLFDGELITARETGQIFATRDLPAGLESLLEQGPNQAIFEGR
jgi:hypothetical protein